MIAMLVNNGYDISAGATQDFVEPIRATVTGYAFFDSAHWMKKNPKKGHGHGTKYVALFGSCIRFGSLTSRSNKCLTQSSM